METGMFFKCFPMELKRKSGWIIYLQDPIMQHVRHLCTAHERD